MQHNQPLVSDSGRGIRGVVALLRIALGINDSAEAMALVADADPILIQLKRHRVGGFLFQKLPPSALSVFPEPFQQSLRRIALENSKRGLGRVGELRRILGHLESRHIRVLAFKGPVTELEYYGQQGIRHVGDLDLLVHPEDLPSADALVSELGYHRSFPPGTLSPVQWKHFLRSHHELNHRDQARRRLVELQWELGGLPTLSFESLWNGRRSLPIAGARTPTVALEHCDLHLFVHGASHRWQLLFWLVDAALLLQKRSRQELDLLLSQARQQRVDRAVLQGARVAHTILGIPLPDSWHRATLSDPVVQTLTAEAIQQLMRNGRDQGGVITMLKELRYLWQLQPGFSARIALLRPRILSVDNWSLCPLPDALFWLYYPLAPFLWAFRQLQRGKKIGPLRCGAQGHRSTGRDGENPDQGAAA